MTIIRLLINDIVEVAKLRIIKIFWMSVYFLGILHMRLNELTEAHDVFSLLVTLDPSDQAVARQLEIIRKSIASQTQED